jgi:hypothetical protein
MKAHDISLLICQGLIIVCGVLMALFPLDKSATHILELPVDLDWLAFSWQDTARIHGVVHFANGLVLGILLALILSGQLLGIKKSEQNMGDAATV